MPTCRYIWTGSGVGTGVVGALAAAALAAMLAGCGGSGGHEAGATRQSVEAYVAQVEPIRLGTNRLLDRADPILSAYHDHRLGAHEAQQRMGVLERRLAEYAVRIAALELVPAALRAAQRGDAHPWVLEDS